LGLDPFFIRSTLPQASPRGRIIQRCRHSGSREGSRRYAFSFSLVLQITASALAITLVVDSLGLRDSMVGHSGQSDGSVMIDVACLRESYHNQELKIAWCPTRDMLADPCKKSGADCTRLMKVLNVSHLAVTIADVRQSSLE
jgi:hypothetical protein